MPDHEYDDGVTIGRNKSEYALYFDGMHWITPSVRSRASRERDELLGALTSRIHSDFNGSKLFSHRLSPGCRSCGKGSWSCLFINNVCNGNCFYCPAEQHSKDIPTTATFQFKTPRDYVDYLRTFGFKGASISGGEPFLTLDLTLRYVSHIKRHFGNDLYLWIYTNGILATRDNLSRLRDAGVDEIRFNIGATGYHLDKVRLAVGVIPHVTVEIPAIPEDHDILKTKIIEMTDCGVDFLNLHQIRCTPYNVSSLIARDYTFLHGPRVTVLESELTALRILKFIVDEKIELPVNYCAYIFRNRYQSAGARRRYAPFVSKSFEDITLAGQIRSLSLKASPSDIEDITAYLRKNHQPESRWYVTAAKDRLFFCEKVLPLLNCSNYSFYVSYYTASLRPAVTYRHPFHEITLNRSKKVFIERSTVHHDLELTPFEIALFHSCFISDNNACPDFADRIGSQALSNDTVYKWRRILNAERIPQGLMNY